MSKQLEEIIKIYETQVEHGMRVIQLNKLSFEWLLNQAKHAEKRS